MPLFHYKIKDAEGAVKEATREARDKFELSKDLKQGGAQVIAIEEVSQKKSIDIMRIFNRVKMQDLIMFSKNLSAMITAGLSLSRALGVLERQTNNPRLKEILHDLNEEIGRGTTLSEAMKKYPKSFSALFISMVHAGEESGKLAEALQVIGEQLEKSYTLRKKIKGAMIYPAVVISAMIVIAILLFIYVVPTLLGVFESMKVDLPASTKFIVLLSNLIQHDGILLIAMFALIITGFVYGMRTAPGRRAFEWFVLHMPIVSGIAKESNAATTTRTLSSLLASGVDIVEAITITKDVVQNSYYKDVLDRAAKNVQKGVPLSSAFIEAEAIYPILVGEMIEVGEETGKLSDMLLRVAMFYEAEVEAATRDMATIIEPLLMLLIGGGVGFFAVSMITPMYSVMNNI
ncbi:MAG: type II secretion system F family protein [Minisyncoccota bacterium]